MHKSKHVLIHCRRKLRADVAATFPTLSAEQLSEVVPNKEELNVIKLYTHKGDAITVYANSRNPVMFEMEKTLYPTGDIVAGSLLLWSWYSIPLWKQV